MAPPKGNKFGNGRPVGAVNKLPRDLREAFKKLVEDNVDAMTLWLNKIAEKNPAQAMQLILDMAEHVIPKLSRAELTGQGGGPIDLVAIITNAQLVTTHERLAEKSLIIHQGHMETNAPASETRMANPTAIPQGIQGGNV